MPTAVPSPLRPAAARGGPRDYGASVVIAPQYDAEHDPSGLAALLRAYLAAAGRRAPEHASLAALLEQAVSRGGLRG